MFLGCLFRRSPRHYNILSHPPPFPLCTHAHNSKMMPGMPPGGGGAFDFSALQNALNVRRG